MSNGGGDLAARAARRVRTFSTLSWIVGGAVALFVAWTGLDGLRVADGGIVDEDAAYYGGDYPWEQAEPTELTIDGDGTLSGPAGGSVLRIPAAERTDAPLALTLTGDEDPYLRLSQTPAGAVDFDAAPDDREYPNGLGWIEPGQPGVVLPGDEDLELWFRADDAWEVTVTPIEAIGLQDVVDGKGDAFLYYDGKRTVARGEHVGEGSFYVRTFTPQGYDFPVIESGTVDVDFSWIESPVLIAVESDSDRGAWTISVYGEEQATLAPTETPAPSGSPGPADPSAEE